jgi:hypothetical protein
MGGKGTAPATRWASAIFDENDDLQRNVDSEKGRRDGRLLNLDPLDDLHAFEWLAAVVKSLNLGRT